ncbi:MAG TPA: PKD domain-containing protein [Patescibacteria group bacterium]|nr:PKD domain-containing protein [Patescibacteria group bacterium]
MIPLTVYLVGQQQKLKVGAAPSAVLSFTPATVSTTAGQQFSEDVMINPGTNQVSFVKLKITYDSTKVSTAGAGLVPNSSIFSGAPLQGPTYTSNSIDVTLSVGSNPLNAISTLQKVATVTFKALDSTGTTPSIIKYEPDPQTQVLSIGTADQFNENVLASSQPANITITGSLAASPPASTVPAGAGTTSSNKVPVCTSLVIDRSATGTAPYALTFTAVGNDPDGTISKVTFQFGDGGTTDVTTGGGIGTASVNVQSSHQYNNPGTFTAKAILTDNQSGVSNGSCTQTITVNAATGGASTTTQTVTVARSATPSATPVVFATPIATPIPKPTLAPTGPGDKFLSVGALGIISTIIGAIILLAL